MDEDSSDSEGLELQDGGRVGRKTPGWLLLVASREGRTLLEVVQAAAGGSGGGSGGSGRAGGSGGIGGTGGGAGGAVVVQEAPEVVAQAEAASAVMKMMTQMMIPTNTERRILLPSL